MEECTANKCVTISRVTTALAQLKGNGTVPCHWGFPLDHVASLCHLLTATPTTVVFPSTCVLEVAAIRFHTHALGFSTEELDQPRLAQALSHGCQQLLAWCRTMKPSFWGLRAFHNFFFFTPLVSHLMFSLLGACLTAVSDWVLFFALSMDY